MKTRRRIYGYTGGIAGEDGTAWEWRPNLPPLCMKANSDRPGSTAFTKMNMLKKTGNHRRS
jgi:hypothetical protein